ncbi:hypothetical protein [Actinomadura sp. CNU-125]|uniref:hypothetical protein n=1 Tax=Actinomadura sp. CNU-125 TaxID=1904961 RepID=UPI001300E5EF|nr:hypothetical protein [Actinomadura sp. CNU-125]
MIAIDPLGLGASDAPHDRAAYAVERRAEYVVAVRRPDAVLPRVLPFLSDR